MRLAACFFLSLFLISSAFASADTCEDSLNHQWIELLENTRRAETLFNDRGFYYLKYWETLYNPLWSADVKRRDTLSDRRKAEGEILFARYQSEAETFFAQMEEAETEMRERLGELNKLVRLIPLSCSSRDFRLCMAPRSTDLSERLQNLIKILDLRKSLEVEFTARVQASVHDRPSDHDDFASRYQDYLLEIQTLNSIKILRLFRELREAVEIEWPGPKCCAFCQPQPGDSEQDPVLSRLRPSDQGQTGLDGRIVNNASLVKAFDEFEDGKMKEEEGYARS